MRKLPEKGIITIAFDDAYLATYKHAIPYLDKVNVKSTIAVVSSLIGKTFENRPVMGIKELKRLIVSGHEIASHTLTHPNLARLGAKDKDAAIFEIAESKRKLSKLLNYEIRSFVFPYITESEPKSLKPQIKNYYKSARATCTSPYFNKTPLKDPHAIVGFAVMRKHSLSYLKKQVDDAARKKRWLIMVFHLVARRNTLSAHRPRPYRFFMHIDDFKKHIDYILSKDVMMLTQKDVIRKFGHGI